MRNSLKYLVLAPLLCGLAPTQVAAVSPLPCGDFDTCDTDYNGKLNLSEFTVCLNFPEDAEVIFESADLNRDGELSREEYNYVCAY